MGNVFNLVYQRTRMMPDIIHQMQQWNKRPPDTAYSRGNKGLDIGPFPGDTIELGVDIRLLLPSPAG